MTQSQTAEPTRREQVVNMLADALLRLLKDKGAACGVATPTIAADSSKGR